MAYRISSLLFITCITVFSSCSKYGYVNLNYPLAPQMDMPENIKTIALVNHSINAKGDDANIFEAIATAEVAGSDRLASDECLLAVFNQGNGQRGMTFVIPQHSKLPRKGGRGIPEL